MRNVKQIKDIKGRVVLVRVDFNVPIENGRVEDDFRVKKALPTIEFLQKKEAKLVLISHHSTPMQTLAPVAEALGKFIKVKFVSEIVGGLVEETVSKMKDGDVILLENLRNDKGEQDCNQIFALNLAKFANLYVNEAFPVSHRGDASIVLLPKLLPAYAGFQLEMEIKNLSRAFLKPKRPFLFILGGAKFSTKMPLIQKYLALADQIFIGGALANDFLKAKGCNVGKSLVDDADYNIEKFINNPKLILPSDVVVSSGGQLINKKVTEVLDNEIILDIGAETVENLSEVVLKAKFVLWNGPLGKYEDGGAEGTKKILKSVAASKAESVIGGGDTASLVTELELEDRFSFVSTGGGAALDFLANGTLPGIKALE